MNVLQLQRWGLVSGLFVLFAAGLGLAAGVGAPAAKKDEEKIPAVLMEPRYDVPSGARDPFQPSAYLTGIVPVEEAAAGSGKAGVASAATKAALPVPRGVPTPEEICRAVTVQAVLGGGSGGSSAILNGQLAKTGDILRVMVRGQAYEVVVKRVDLAASAATVAYKDYEMVVSVRAAKKSAP